MTDAGSRPLVSVIVPVFNTKPYLAQALDSLIKQTYKNLEILVIDDGSSDGSGALCDEIRRRDPRIRVVHQENRGLSGARNTGLRLMNGDYVTFLDSDDWYHREMIETLVRGALASDAGITVCDVDLQPWPKGRKPMPGGIFSPEEVLGFILERSVNVNVWNKLFRREIWEGPVFPEGRCYEDSAIIHELLFRTERICLIPERLICYRNRNDSITKNVSLDNARDYLWAAMRLPKYAADHKDMFDEETRARILRYTFRKLLQRYYRLYTFDREGSVQAREYLRFRKKYGTALTRLEKAVLTVERICPAAFVLLFRARAVLIKRKE